MNSLKDRDSVYFSYVIINFLWYASCIGAILIIGFFISKHAFGITMAPLNINVPIDADYVTLQTDIESSAISTIDSATASLDTEYIIDNYFGRYIGIVLSLFISIALFLTGFFQLRMILKSTLNDEVFTSKNVTPLKVLAGILIAYSPLYWIFIQLFVVPLESELIVHKISISLGISFNLGLFVYGLLLFALAAVFEKGHDMYQDLKLTV